MMYALSTFYSVILLTLKNPCDVDFASVWSGQTTLRPCVFWGVRRSLFRCLLSLTYVIHHHVCGNFPPSIKDSGILASMEDLCFLLLLTDVANVWTSVLLVNDFGFCCCDMDWLYCWWICWDETSMLLCLDFKSLAILIHP